MPSPLLKEEQLLSSLLEDGLHSSVEEDDEPVRRIGSVIVVPSDTRHV